MKLHAALLRVLCDLSGSHLVPPLLYFSTTENTELTERARFILTRFNFLQPLYGKKTALSSPHLTLLEGRRCQTLRRNAQQNGSPPLP